MSDTTRVGIRPKIFTALAITSFVSLFLIVLTGAAVRLTDSGLGCEDWPNCDQDAIIDAWSYHASIEFGNRLLSGLVGLVCLATAVASIFRKPRRKDLILWSAFVVLGVLVQAVLGRFSVTTHLHPLVVAAHFLGSPILLWMSLVLVVRSRLGPVQPGYRLPAERLWPMRSLLVAASLVLAIGTLVTGSGPNGGDTRADRLDIGFTSIARLHSLTAWAFVALAVTVAVGLARVPNRPSLSFGLVRAMLVLSLAQGGVGYFQYLNGVPPLAVELHIFGATAIWCLAVAAYLHLFDEGRVGDNPPQEPGSDKASYKSASLTAS